jgi:hypothetical protein
MKRLPTWAVALACAASIVGSVTYLATVPTEVRATLLFAKTTGGGGGAPTGSCSQSTAFFARVWALPATLDGTVGGSGHVAAYDNLICGLVTDGVFATLDTLWVTATAAATGSSTAVANLNLVSSSFPLIAAGSPAFTANSGYDAVGEGSATGVYMHTGFTPSSSGGHQTLNNTTISAYTFTNFQSGSQYYMNGATDGTQGTGICPRSNTDQLLGQINEPVSLVTNVAAIGSSNGSTVVVRTANNASVIYRAGVPRTTVVLQNSSALVTAELDFSAQNFNGAHYASPWQGASMSIGSQLTALQVSSLGSTAVTSGNAAGQTGLVPRLCVYMAAIHGSC